MSDPKSINVEGLTPLMIRGLEQMISTLRDELQQKTVQPEQIEEKHPWKVIEGIKIGAVTREDFYDDL